MSRPPNFSSRVRRDDPFWLLGDDQKSSTREPAKTPTTAAPPPPSSWWSRHSGAVTKGATGLLDAASPLIQKGLDQTGLTTPPTPATPLPPSMPHKATSTWVYIGVGAGALTLVGVLALVLGGHGKKRGK